MIDVKRARILITNDDGIDAPGIAVLERVAKSLSDDVWVIAPASEQSAVSRALTVRRSLRIQERGERRFSVDGTPTDSVFMAIHEVMADRPPDLVLSGINNGGNLAEDVYYSGTVAAAMEGAALGVPAIALSQRFAPGGSVRWETAEKWTAAIILKLCGIEWKAGLVLSVNFPDVPALDVKGIACARLGRRTAGITYKKCADDGFRIGADRGPEDGVEGDDLFAVRRGFVAVTPLKLDCTDYDFLERLRLHDGE
ncbi:5'-nucleotidase SurE [Alphaproteobacteria bacterium]|nr:5'-nucleotidase SurE [Alphaproteobacteria bacterium]